ncbi:MAG: recombination mediator RecR [Planctomycetota bacterium]
MAEGPAPNPPPQRAGSAGRGGYPESVERVIAELARLPGIGRRTAERLAFFLLKAPRDDATGLARAITAMRDQVGQCGICGNLTDASPCDICGAATAGEAGRDGSVVLVIEQPKDLIAVEQSGAFRGVYHVLMGRLSPLDGVGPADINIADLLARVDEPARNAGGVRVAEVVLGLNPTLEGDGTAMYLARELETRGVKVSRLARGLPTGSQLEWVSKAVLADAIEGRHAF